MNLIEIETKMGKHHYNSMHINNNVKWKISIVISFGICAY